MSQIQLSCSLGSCPSGPTAGTRHQEWRLADGRLVHTVVHPLNRYGDIDHVEVDIWGRDGYLHDAFGSPYGRGEPESVARKWLAQHGAVRIDDWTVAFHLPSPGRGWQEVDRAAQAAYISAAYDAAGVSPSGRPWDAPYAKPTDYAIWERGIGRAAAAELDRIERRKPVPPTSRIVGGTRRRRNARRRVNR